MELTVGRPAVTDGRDWLVEAWTSDAERAATAATVLGAAAGACVAALGMGCTALSDRDRADELDGVLDNG